ncbi:DUF6090 family protein [Robertkochia flava]|uniref:DUF6090 family protein n=1 Tax=Robertkochia flava TaxID=3447986 RepID=UPI001CD01A87|nr:DUF6090 family protein [Robertkochia marina]
MFRIFRKVREKLLRKGAIAAYLKYAIGEVVLIIMGIFLALQLNNWNEERKQGEEAQRYMKALRSEYRSNLQNLEEIMEINTRNLQSARELLNYMGPDPKDISDEKLSALYFGVMAWEVEFRPGSGVLNEVINAGKLSIFDHEELKALLSSWDGEVLKVRFQEEEHGATRMEFIEILKNSGFSFRKSVYDNFKDHFGFDQTDFSTNNKKILQIQTVENSLVSFIVTGELLHQNYYMDIHEKTLRILDILDRELSS